MRSAVCALTLLVLVDPALAQPAPPVPDPTIADVAPVEPPPVEAAPVAPLPVPASAPVAAPAVPVVAPAPADRGFRFGSYGRIVVGSDLRGGKPEGIKVVAVAPRVVEPSYFELDFSMGLVTPRGLTIRPVMTVAFNSVLFHETGDFDAQPALRNLYLDAQVTDRWSAWVGSRMYRGDDIYLLDYWPLDDQNTVGGGVLYRGPIGAGAARTDLLELAAHAGVNRLTTPFQLQEIEVADPEQGATTIVQLNRQRMVASADAAYIHRGAPSALSYKAKLHGELHGLPAGSRRRFLPDGSAGELEPLPADLGFLVGGELSLFGWQAGGFDRRHVNLYARYARGLAAFDELAQPTSVGRDLKTSGASELTFGTSTNWDADLGSVIIGALARRFIDADPAGEDPDDGWEYAVAVRPLARVTPELSAGADVSYQARFPRGLNPSSLRAEDPAVFQIAPMLVFSPMGKSSYDRPQLRLVYRAAYLNEGALALYAPADPRSERTWVHFLGFQAEWWFNSTRYN